MMDLVVDINQPPKRRKTSPIHSLNPIESHTSTRPASQDGPRSTPIRPSFMSPTKASLARFHPHLLPPPPSVDNNSARSSDGQIQCIGDEHRPESNMGRKMVNGSPTALHGSKRMAADTEELVEEADLALPGSTVNGTAGVPYIISPKKSRTPLEEPLNTRQSKANEVLDTRTSPPEQYNSPHLRASPAEAVGDGEQVTHDRLDVQMVPPLQPSISERTNPTIDGEKELEQTIEEEPGLPYTPTKSMVDNAKPRLPSTPSQLGLEAPSSPPKGLLLSSPSRRPKRKIRSHARSSPLKPGTSTAETEVVHVSSLGPRIPVANPQPSVASQLEGANISSSVGYVLHFDSSFERIELTWYFRARANPADSIACISQKPSSLAQRLALFLPFSRPIIPGSDPSSAQTESLNGDPSKPTAPSTLKTTVKKTLPASTTGKNPALKHQLLTLSSSQNLFNAKIEITLDKATQKVTNLAISSLSSWATPELGPWLETEAVNLEKSTIERTISRYWELSEVRASCWHKCERDLQHQSTPSEPAPGIAAEGQGNTQLPNTQPPTQGKCDSTASANPSRDKSRSTPPTPQHLGQQSILFIRSPHISLLITWRITISPSGTVNSRLSAHATFPEPWTQAPGGEALNTIGETFDLLIHERGVFGAVKAIWSTIFEK